MQKMRLLDIARFTSPNPVALICARPQEGTTNLMTASWYTMLSVEPERIGFALMKSHFTGELIRQTKEAVLTIPGASLARQVMGCGATSGRDTDKIKKFGIAMQEIAGTNILIPEHSVAAVRCQLHEVVDVGDHYFYVCDALETLLADEPEETLFAWKGYAQIATVSHMTR